MNTDHEAHAVIARARRRRRCKRIALWAFAIAFLPSAFLAYLWLAVRVIRSAWGQG